MIHHTDNLILDYWNPYIEIHYHIQIDTKDFHIWYSYNRIDSLEFIKILINNFNLGHLSQIQNLKDFKVVWNLGRVDLAWIFWIFWDPWMPEILQFLQVWFELLLNYYSLKSLDIFIPDNA